MAKTIDKKSGVFPQGSIDRSSWETVRLGDIGELFKGRGFSMKDTVYSGVPCTMYGDIYVKYGERFWSTDYRLPSDLAEQCPQIHHGDLIFTLSGETAEEIGKCAGFLGTGSVCIGGDILALRPTDKYDAEFLCYAMNSPDCIRQKAQFGQGDAVVHISQQNLSSVELHIPTRSEQRRIATSLSAVDSRLEALSSLLAKQEAIKKSTLSLLMQPKAGWRQHSLGEIGQFFKGRGFSMRDTVSTGVPCTMYGDIYVKYSERFYDVDFFIPDSLAKKCPNIQHGDLLFTLSGETAEEIGKCAGYFGTKSVCIGGDILALRPNAEFDSAFLSYLMNSPDIVRQKAMRGQGDAVVHISQQNLSTIQFEAPPIDRQMEIASSLVSIDESIDGIRAGIEKTQAIKASLMRYFFG